MNNTEKYKLIPFAWIFGYSLLMLFLIYFGDYAFAVLSELGVAWMRKFQEDPIELFTATLAISTLFLWIDTNGLRRLAANQSADMKESLRIANNAADAAMKSNEISREIFIATERPWVSADVSINGPLQYKENGLTVYLNCTLTNVGHSPATNLFIDNKLTTIAMDRDIKSPSIVFSPHAKLQEMVEFNRKLHPTIIGEILFPGESNNFCLQMFIDNKLVDQLKQKQDYILLTAVLCIGYGSAIDNSYHHTGAILNIYRKERPELIMQNGEVATIKFDEGEIPAVQLLLFRDLSGNTVT